MAFAGGGGPGGGGAGWGAGCRPGGVRLINRGCDSACSHAPLKSVTRTTLARWPRAFPRAPDPRSSLALPSGALASQVTEPAATLRSPLRALTLGATCSSGPRFPRPDSPIHPPPARCTILRATSGPIRCSSALRGRPGRRNRVARGHHASVASRPAPARVLSRKNPATKTRAVVIPLSGSPRSGPARAGANGVTTPHNEPRLLGGLFRAAEPARTSDGLRCEVVGNSR